MAQQAHPTQWSTDDFDVMSWHDVHFHGFRLIQNESDSGTAELIFDIDYILEWINVDGTFKFLVAQARLQFHEVFDLTLALDYVSPNAGMCPFSISGIVRERVTYPTGYVSYRWRLEVNWPAGEIEFESPGFTQTLVGKPYTQTSQDIEPSQRTYTNSE
ncbi:MAG: hypothetical protein LBE75_07265 [Burkholderiales bacterium]|jgi:hypothetical protein|nr:hypothetical protein [Burkholderiales bacterium]